jgi:hypothetical protein
MMKHNIVFLDIDGVINTPQNAVARLEQFKTSAIPHRDEFGQLFCPRAVSNLEYLCHAAFAKVVISSTWRRMGLTNILNMMHARNIQIDVIDITPDLSYQNENGIWISGTRGREIAEWLQKNPVDRYVIIDDDNDMLPEQLPYFVRTNFKDGFNWKCMTAALKILIPK